MRARNFAAVFGMGLLALSCAHGGDAVVVGYNAAGAWTSVTYYASGSPKGGADYKDEASAKAAALRDLKRRGGDLMVESKVLASSDRTGNFTVARAKDGAGKDRLVVGSGKSQAEADNAAITKLDALGAKTGQTVMYRYHSFGSDAPRS